MTSSKNNKTIINKIFLTCLLFMLVFSVFNITKVFAGIDNIVIQDVSIVDKSSTVDASITGHNRDSLATNITYHNVNDYVEFKITLKNNDSKKYTIKTISDNNSNSNIIYEYDKHENEELASGSEKDLNIKITYKNEVTNKNGRNVNNNVQIKITFIDEDGNEDDKVIPINPQTSDNLIIYIITGSLSLIGLIVLLNNKKINKLLLMLLLITPFATKALTLSYVINFNSSVKLYDKMLVTIDVNGNKEERLIPYNSKITEPDPVSIPGYEFVGWYSGDSVFNFNNNITEDTVIEAKYNLLTYNITYNLNGGTVSGNPTTYTVEDEFTLNNPTKRGYTFAGWTGSNGDNLQTRVTVNKGTINNLNFVAHFTESTDTPYLVVHKYKNLNSDTYTTEEEHLTGATNSTVYPQIKHKNGFIDPTVQSLTISPDGDSEITYTYNRETYSYSYDSNVNSDLAVGTYEYETPIIVTPKVIPGYTFTKWEDNSTNNPRTIILSSDTSVVPTYTANTNTEYTVVHRYQTLNNTYEEETVTGHGTTDTTVPAPRQPRTGFVTPTEQNITILGDGSGSVTYTYNRETYSYSYDSNVISSKEAGTYMHGTEITVSPKEIPGYTFIKWEDDSTTVPRTITLTSNLAVGATYETNGDTPYTVNHKYQKLDLTYTTETKTEHGETGATVNAPRQPRTGFETPNEQSVTINGDGSSEVTYTYDRETYSYTYDSNVISSENAGNKMYGTEITVRPKEIPGYTFAKWEDNSTDNPRTITLTGALNVVPTYTANTNTDYTVIHRYQTLNNTYEEETVTGHGTTDTTVPAARQPRTGFVTPNEQNVTILGDGSGSVTYTYNRITYQFNITDRTYIDSTSTLDGEYMYGTEITAKAIERAGYTFKWNDNDTNYTKTFTLTDDVTLTPTYTANTDTAYTVNHYTQKLDGTYEIKETEVLTGTTDTDATPLTKSYTGFTSPSLQTKNIEGDGSTEFDYLYLRDKYTLTIDNPSDVVQGDISGQYYYEEQITLTAKDKEGYTFTKWSNNETTKTITITMGTSDITVGPIYEINSYTITFDTQGGTPVSSIVQDYGEPIGTIEVTTKDGFTFDGWFTDPDAGTEIDENTLVTGNDTYYAHWTEIVDDIICIKATTLTSEECESGIQSGQGCKGTGYASGETITYGNISSSDTIQVGDSYFCDVDGTGYNERFYYLRTVDNKAVLILDHSVAEKIYGRDDPASHIPTTSTWSNLPITFDDNKAARFPTNEDLQEAIGGGDTTTSGALDPINFIFEKTSYANTSGGYGSTVWILYNDVLDHRYHKNGRNVADTGNNTPANSYNSVRPVIEVPISNLDDSYIVTFDAGAGTVTNEYVLVERNHSLGTLPTATYGNMILEGWYKENTHINKISSSTVPTGYETYYANWKTKVEDAILQEDSFSLELNESEQIVITNESDLEPYTYSSSDDTVVTVDSNGLISSVDYGTANIIITGEISGTTKVIPVDVSEDTSDFIVTFESLGGPDVAPMNVPRHTAIGTLPAPTWTNYDLEGWYTDSSFSEKITPSTVINGNRTFYARWIPSDAVAVIGTSDYYTSIQAAVDESTTTKTIKLLKDVTLTAAIDLSTKNTNKNIVLDLNGHTITVLSSTNINTIKNKATLEVKNGTINSNAKQGAINSEGGTVTISNMNIVTNERQAVNNEGGNVIINGLVASSNTSGSYNQVTRGTVQNNSGTTTIISATITNRNNNGAAVSLGSGTLTVGTKDDIYDTNNIVIQGGTYGIISKTNYNLYDGMIKGKTAAVDSESRITGVEDNSTKVNDEVDGYKRLYYTVVASSFKITFDPTDGTVSPTYINVNNGDSVASTDVPTPTRGIYSFDGWYYDDQYQNIVTYPFTPNENKTLYAKWSYTPSDTPVSFNMTNDVMMDYYSNINTWKNQYTVSGTKTDNSGYTEVLNTNEFQASMRANFDAHNCSYCGTDANQNSCSNPSSGEYCERPKGYDTGLGETVNVYEYDTNTHEKTLITYTTNNNGIIYNMIPGKTYRWESASDSNVYGYVAPTARRRTIYSSVRNVRDLGGMEVSFTRNNTTKTGTLKYGKLFRGAELSGGQSDVNSLTKLGITREVDLRVKTEGTNPKRLPKHDKCDSGDCVNITTDQDIIMTNYLIYPDSYSTNFNALRDTMRYVMQSVVDGDNIYFHCTIGTDRTGTLAYFLEGLLGVSEEEKLEDYELSYFYGMLNRHRFHDNLVSGANINPRFLSMYKTYDTNEKIYNLYMSGLSSEQKQQEDALIEQFRDAMINYN